MAIFKTTMSNKIDTSAARAQLIEQTAREIASYALIPNEVVSRAEATLLKNAPYPDAVLGVPNTIHPIDDDGTWYLQNETQAVKAAFAKLRKQGYTARYMQGCCSSCVWAELAVKFEKKGMSEADMKDARVVFCNSQERDAINPDGTFKRPIYLQWSAPGKDASEIVNALRSVGLKVVAPVDQHSTICVEPQATLEFRKSVERTARLITSALYLANRVAYLAGDVERVKELVRVDRLYDVPATDALYQAANSVTGSVGSYQSSLGHFNRLIEHAGPRITRAVVMSGAQAYLTGISIEEIAKCFDLIRSQEPEIKVTIQAGSPQ